MNLNRVKSRKESTQKLKETVFENARKLFNESLNEYNKSHRRATAALL